MALSLSCGRRRYYDEPKSNSEGCVLHVAKLLANFVFVHKLTIDLHVWWFLILQPANFRI